MLAIDDIGRDVRFVILSYWKRRNALSAPWLCMIFILFWVNVIPWVCVYMLWVYLEELLIISHVFLFLSNNHNFDVEQTFECLQAKFSTAPFFRRHLCRMFSTIKCRFSIKIISSNSTTATHFMFQICWLRAQYKCCYHWLFISVDIKKNWCCA